MAAPAGYGRDVRRDVDVVLEVAAAGPSLVHGALLVLLFIDCYKAYHAVVAREEMDLCITFCTPFWRSNISSCNRLSGKQFEY